MILGATLGALGSIVNAGLGIYKEKVQIAAEEKRRSDEYEIAKLNASKEKQITAINADAQSLAASYKHDTETGDASPWVINIIRLVRPSITFYALGLITVFWFFATDVDRAIIITATLDICSMAVAWWFGDRGISRIRR
jgi:hypothetical protein